MEKFEQMPKTERKCDICGDAHWTYHHKGKVDIEKRQKEQAKGKPAEVEKRIGKTMEGETNISQLEKEMRGKLFKGRPEELAMRKEEAKKKNEEYVRKLRENEELEKENISKLREGKSGLGKEDIEEWKAEIKRKASKAG